MSLYDNLSELVKQISRPKPSHETRENFNNNVANNKRSVTARAVYQNQPVAEKIGENVSRRESDGRKQRGAVQPNVSGPWKNNKQNMEAVYRQQAESVPTDIKEALYIGNLRWWISDQIISELFSQFGVVRKIKIETDKITGKSKGFGYVQFDLSNQNAASHACEKLNGYFLEDNGELVVQFATQKHSQPNPAANNFATNGGGEHDTRISGGVVNSHPTQQLLNHGLTVKTEGAQTQLYPQVNQTQLLGERGQIADIENESRKRRRLTY